MDTLDDLIKTLSLDEVSRNDIIQNFQNLLNSEKTIRENSEKYLKSLETKQDSQLFNLIF